MQEGDIVKIDLLVEYSGSRKSKEAWNRIKKDFEELAQQTHISKSMPCSHCEKFPAGETTLGWKWCPWCGRKL